MAAANGGFVIGRLVADVEEVQVGDYKVYKGAVACRNAGPKEDGEYTAGFFDFEAWGKTGELLSQLTEKGKEVVLMYRLKQNRWTNQEGERRQDKILEVYDFQLTSGGGNREQAPAAVGGGAAEGGAAPAEYDPFADE